MARAESLTWYRIALARPGAAPALVAAQGAHLGAAIAAAERHAGKARAFAAEVAAEADIPLGDSVGKRRVVELAAPPGLEAPAFRFPAGVIPQLGARIAGRRGFVRRADPALLVLEAQTDADHVVDLFLGLIERLPAADNLEIRLLGHYDDAGATDVWLTSRVNAKKILGFLDAHEVELLANGHLDVSVYVRAHKATLRLTEHKTVVWLAEGGALEAEVTGWLRELEVPRVDPLDTISAVAHYHCRAANSRDRAALGESLYRQRLRRVATIAAPPPGASD